MKTTGALVLALSLAGSQLPARADEKAGVWFWFATCGGPSMTVELRLDDRTILKSSLPLCRGKRDSAAGQGQAARIRVSFAPHRAITWEGYRDEAVTTDPDQLIEADIWQAGADPDDLALGLSFSSPSDIYMNTVLIAHPARHDETVVAKGLVLATYPAEPVVRGSH